MQAQVIEKLKRTWPNTPLNWARPFSDKRFTQMWCPFHQGRLVGLSVYEPWAGEFWIQYCDESCHFVGQRIEGLLKDPEPRVEIYVTSRGTVVYESRRSFGSMTRNLKHHAGGC